jgi:hypothetical protein
VRYPEIKDRIHIGFKAGIHNLQYQLTELMNEEINRLPDGTIDRAHYETNRKKIDGLKWFLSRLYANEYAERKQITGEGGGTIQIAIQKFSEEDCTD